jgi:hypothetical protein
MKGQRRGVLGGVVGLLVLVTAGFAAAAIASGSSLGDILTGTTATTGTTETTDSTVTSAGVGQRKVVICHHTHSRKHPWVTITVGWPAAAAHVRHGDTLGACAPAQPGVSAPHGHDHGHGGNVGPNSHHGSKSHGSGNGSQGNGKGGGQGNAGGHGGGKP